MKFCSNIIKILISVVIGIAYFRLGAGSRALGVWISAFAALIVLEALPILTDANRLVKEHGANAYARLCVLTAVLLVGQMALSLYAVLSPTPVLYIKASLSLHILYWLIEVRIKRATPEKEF